MRSPRSEKRLSPRFVETAAVRSAARWAALALVALVVAACGASAPQKAAVDKPAGVGADAQAGSAAPQTKSAAPKQAAASPSPNAKPAARSERRGRRGESAPPADGTEPIPAVAQSAYDRALAAMRADDWLQAELELEQLTRD